ncbi:MAG: O-antigen ligase family protein [Candidatus Shapirobacteria bacterium]|nr:O-antigen ligase family protein [Candidatus Shapirobacteria bacterium]
MALVSKVILFFTFFAFFIGQIFRINLLKTSFPLIDIAIILLFLINIFNHLKNKDLKIKNKFFLYFLCFAWVFLFFNLIRYQIYSFNPIFYLIRFSCLLSFFIFPLKIDLKLKNSFNLFIIANIIFGFIQYFFWPNFTYFDALNWDPHLYRLVSTFFDPTFTGLIYLLFLIKLFLDKKFPYRKLLLILTYIAMALTYSRSTYLAFLFSFLFISKKLKNIKIFLISLIIILGTIFILPRQPGEGTKLERTSSIKAKIENYQEVLKTFTQAPVIGSGYNTLPFIKKINNPNSHANSGFDGSLTTILVTTGIIGTTLFLLGSKNLYQKSKLNQKTFILAIFVHSLFANSLLYPWVILSLIFL